MARGRNIFLCYRREDSAGITGRLKDRLEAAGFTAFMDTEDISSGTDWTIALRQAVTGSDVLIALIGPTWLSAYDQKGRRRLESPTDHVVDEIATALDYRIRTIPVLIDGTPMPGPNVLPPQLTQLANLQALPLRHNSFGADVERLMKQIDPNWRHPGAARATTSAGLDGEGDQPDEHAVDSSSSGDDSASLVAQAPFSGSSLEVLDHMQAVLQRRGSAVPEPEDALLGTIRWVTVAPQLQYADAPANSDILLDLRRFIDKPAAIDAAIVSWTGAGTGGLDAERRVDYVLSPVLVSACSLAARTEQSLPGHARETHPHHVLAAALTSGRPISPGVLGALQVTESDMRSALRGIIAERLPDDPPAVWDEVLGPVASQESSSTPQSPDYELDAAATALLDWAEGVRLARRGIDGEGLDVVYALLVWAPAWDPDGDPLVDPALRGLVDSLGGDTNRLRELVDVALTQSAGKRPIAALEPVSPTSLDDYALVLRRASAIAHRTSPGQPIQQRHLLGAALTSARLPGDLSRLLGADSGELAMRLCGAVTQHWTGEPVETWTAALGLDTLTSRFVSDFVAVGRRRRPGPPAPPLPDRLELDAYVSMLAGTIARKTTAMPLSIGLFGEWGSGKSYFMELLRLRVDLLRQGGTGTPYYSDIVQITFNAWNYADTNLWASLAAEFFDQLGAPDTDPDEERRQAIRATLISQNQVRQELKSIKDAASTRKKTARANYVSAVAARESRSRTLSLELVKAIAQDPEVSASLAAVGKELGVGAEETAKTLQLADDVRGIADDASATRRVLSPKALRVPFMLLLAAVAITGIALFAMPPGVWSKIASSTVVVTIIAFLGTTGRAVGKARTLAGQLRDLALRADQARTRVINDKTVVKAAQALHNAEAEETIAQARLADLDSTISQLDRQLDELEPGRRLYQFIAERAASVDYRSQLGVVSSVRRDFEQLVRLMDEWRHNEYPVGSGPHKPLDRIVLYVDDLDRCEPDQVVQVLQAVHLLLAMDLFVVVVGVDPRWLLRALRRRYRRILGRSGLESADRGLGFEESTPQNYLEKIFQIPFVLPGMTSTGFSRLIRSLAAPDEVAASRPPAVTESETTEETPSNAEDRDATSVSQFISRAESGTSAPTAAARSAVSHEPVPVRLDARSESAQVSAAADPQNSATVAEIVSTPITERELILLSRLAPLVRTPRAATRLFNIYGILRSATDLSPGQQFLGGLTRPGDYQAVAQLLGVLTAAPELLGLILWGQPAQGQPDNVGLCRAPGLASWSQFVDDLLPYQNEPAAPDPARDDGQKSAELGPPANAPTWSNAVAAEIPADKVDDWRDLVTDLQALRDVVKLDDIKRYQVWGPQIARFSFLLSPFAVDAAAAG
jgi:hypothetical protein